MEREKELTGFRFPLRGGNLNLLALSISHVPAVNGSDRRDLLASITTTPPPRQKGATEDE